MFLIRNLYVKLDTKLKYILVFKILKIMQILFFNLLMLNFVYILNDILN